ncbi:unnamed protein product [Meloidogyne enterolobii]|uniref:Uncharacterized protein n=1 Tax=Meloidogyne enterolobii TaxID=390850 RepID=A0ACB0ZB85_MELEN
MEILVPNFKLKYFVENDPFVDDNQLREHFWEAILSDDKTTKLRGTLALKFFVSMRWIHGEIKKLEEEHPKNRKIVHLNLYFKKKKGIIGSRYDKIFLLDFNEIEEQQDKIIKKLEEEVKETILEMKKTKAYADTEVEEIEESMKDFSKCIQDLIYNELSRQLVIEVAWADTMKPGHDSEGKKKFAIELFDGKI